MHNVCDGAVGDCWNGSVQLVSCRSVVSGSVDIERVYRMCRGTVLDRRSSVFELQRGTIVPGVIDVVISVCGVCGRSIIFSRHCVQQLCGRPVLDSR